MSTVPTPDAGSEEGVDGTPQIFACLDHLTGPARGTTTWLAGSAVDLRVGRDRRLRADPALAASATRETVARLHRADESYEIEVCGDRPVWVNRRRVQALKLAPRDLIEFGETGPLSRFRLLDGGVGPPRTVSGLLADYWNYLQVSRRPWYSRLPHGLRDLVGDIARRTTLMFRLVVVLAIVGLAWSAYTQRELSRSIEEQVESDSLRLDGFSSALGRARQEALRPSDFNALRDELGTRLLETRDRLELLERRSEASAEIIERSGASVAFLQGGYGFKETASGRMLRYLVDDEGRVLVNPMGQPGLTLEGEGPVAEREFTGTGFALALDAGLAIGGALSDALAGGLAMVTNRHVALPWEEDASVQDLAAQGLEPVRTRFIAYFPGRTKATPLHVVAVSDEADLAVLKYASADHRPTGLLLAEGSPRPGEEVLVMGYPTGLRSMLAQTGNAFIEALQSEADLDFWAIAAHLAENRLIRPLASQGIVGQVTPATLVYDAETTSGGSGGPVLDVAGKVVAVNAAILPEYGGSNLGVPVARLRRLLAREPGS